MDEITLAINKIRSYLELFAKQEVGNKLSEFSISGLGSLIEEQLIKIEKAKDDLKVGSNESLPL